MSYLSVNLEILQRDREIPLGILRDCLLVKIPPFHSFCQLYKYPKIQCLLEAAVRHNYILEIPICSREEGFFGNEKMSREVV